MKSFVVGLLLVAACMGSPLQAKVWKPSPGHVQMPIWPGVAPDAGNMGSGSFISG